jgi:import inner membrane translocase subunit TIM50
LFYAAQLYEVVVFSALPQHEGDVIVKKLDPYGCINYSLYRFATKHKKGMYLKDISHLNRDLSKVIVLGHDEAGFSLHPDNFIKTAPWTGDSTDTVLEDSIDFLEMVAFSRLQDVRRVTSQYQGKTFPEAFERAQENVFNTSKEAQKNSLQGWISSWLSVGKTRSDRANNSDASYRARKLERTELRRKEFERIKELMQKQLQAEMQKEKEYYSEHKMALWDLFAKGPPPPPPPKESTAQS